MGASGLLGAPVSFSDSGVFPGFQSLKFQVLRRGVPSMGALDVRLSQAEGSYAEWRWAVAGSGLDKAGADRADARGLAWVRGLGHALAAL